MKFEQRYDEIKLLVKNDLDKVNSQLINFDCSAIKLQQKLFNLLTAPSKRLRPVLAFLYLKANEVDINQKQQDIQTAIELIHNATLIHDDIIDNSELRRNQTTLNKNFDNSLAVIAGDFLLSVALKYVIKTNSFEILNTFAQTIEHMCLGEINQYFTKFKIPTIDDYLKKSEYKTASLFKTSIKSSAIISERLNLEVAENFAENFGIAFQIRDDLLNIINKKDLKPVFNDIENGIYTAPIIFAQNLDNLDSGIEKTKDLLDNYFNKVINLVYTFKNNTYKTALLELIEILRITV